MAIVKRAVSLRPEQDEGIRRIARRRKTAYSAVVRSAVGLYLAWDEKSRLIEEYRSYYRDAKASRVEREAMEEYARLARVQWNEAS